MHGYAHTHLLGNLSAIHDGGGSTFRAFLSRQSRRHLKLSKAFMTNAIRWTNNRLFALHHAASIGDPQAIQSVVTSFHSKAEEWSDIMEVDQQQELADLRAVLALRTSLRNQPQWVRVPRKTAQDDHLSARISQMTNPTWTKQRSNC